MPLWKDREDCAPPETKAKTATQELAHEICASVPFHLGTQSISCKEGDTSYPEIGDEEADFIHQKFAMRLGWLYLFLPMARLATLDELPNEQRIWVANQNVRIQDIISVRYHCPRDMVKDSPASALPGYIADQPTNCPAFPYVLS